MKKKVVITTGGTGGHIYPAMALADQLQPHVDLLFVGGALSQNKYFNHHLYSFKEVSCGMISLKKPFSLLPNGFRMIKGVWQSRKLLKQLKPDVVIGFGSYYTLPLILAAKLCGIPIVLHEANRIPGRVNRLLANHVHLTGVHFPDTALQLKGKTAELPIPLRREFKLNLLSQSEARTHFGLNPSVPTLLIFGGSQGARSINELSSKAICQWVSETNERVQVIHIAGSENSITPLQQRYTQAGIESCVKPFENQMHLAWQAADFMISRAGAGTLAEQLEFEVPGILIPFPQAMDNHQESNADFMTGIIQGAIKCCEGSLTAQSLKEEIAHLFAHEQQLLREMRLSMRMYKRQGSKRQLSDLILEILNQKK